MDINNEIKIYAKSYLKIFSAKPSVYRYYNVDGSKFIDILSVQYHDYPNIVFYSTLGLANTDFGIVSGNKSMRVELICAFYKNYEKAPNLLAQAAFECIDLGRMKPNFIISGIGKENDIFELPDIWIKYPNLLANGNISHEFDDVIITVLQILPISENEKHVMLEQSPEVLEDLFVKRDIDQFSHNRPRII